MSDEKKHIEEANQGLFGGGVRAALSNPLLMLGIGVALCGGVIYSIISNLDIEASSLKNSALLISVVVLFLGVASILTDQIGGKSIFTWIIRGVIGGALFISILSLYFIAMCAFCNSQVNVDCDNCTVSQIPFATYQCCKIDTLINKDPKIDSIGNQPFIDSQINYRITGTISPRMSNPKLNFFIVYGGEVLVEKELTIQKGGIFDYIDSLPQKKFPPYVSIIAQGSNYEKEEKLNQLLDGYSPKHNFVLRKKKGPRTPDTVQPKPSIEKIKKLEEKKDNIIITVKTSTNVKNWDGSAYIPYGLKINRLDLDTNYTSNLGSNTFQISTKRTKGKIKFKISAPNFQEVEQEIDCSDNQQILVNLYLERSKLERNISSYRDGIAPYGTPSVRRKIYMGTIAKGDFDNKYALACNETNTKCLYGQVYVTSEKEFLILIFENINNENNNSLGKTEDALNSKEMLLIKEGNQEQVFVYNSYFVSILPSFEYWSRGGKKPDTKVFNGEIWSAKINVE
jgi:hypothetical protein